MQKPSRPILKKVKQVNFNNPTLNSLGMKGIFFTGGAPPLIRDQLRYNDKYKDALQQEMEQVQTARLKDRNSVEQIVTQKPLSGTKNQTSRIRFHKNQVIEKVNRINMDGALEQQYNFQGFRAIKNKQMHGFNIISNF